MLTRSVFNLTPWTYRRFFDGLNRLQNDLSRPMSAGVFPSINVTQDAEYFYVRAELPGISADELDITVTDKSLAVSGERKIPPAGNGVTYHRREREAGKFSRMFDLPMQIDSENVDAHMVDGILTIKLSKAKAALPKKIAVN